MLKSVIEAEIKSFRRTERQLEECVKSEREQLIKKLQLENYPGDLIFYLQEGLQHIKDFYQNQKHVADKIADLEYYLATAEEKERKEKVR